MSWHPWWCARPGETVPSRSNTPPAYGGGAQSQRVRSTRVVPPLLRFPFVVGEGRGVGRDVGGRLEVPREPCVPDVPVADDLQFPVLDGPEPLRRRTHEGVAHPESKGREGLQVPCDACLPPDPRRLCPAVDLSPWRGAEPRVTDVSVPHTQEGISTARGSSGRRGGETVKRE